MEQTQALNQVVNKATEKQIKFMKDLKIQLKDANIEISISADPSIKEASIYISKALKALKNISVKKVIKKEDKKELVNKYGVKVGDVFCSFWGYEQTNVEFFQVVEILSATKIVLKEVAQQEVKCYSSMSGTVKPIKNEFLENSFFMTYESNKEDNNKYIKLVQQSKWNNEPYICLACGHHKAYLTSWDKEHHFSSYA